MVFTVKYRKNLDDTLMCFEEIIGPFDNVESAIADIEKKGYVKSTQYEGYWEKGLFLAYIA